MKNTPTLKTKPVGSMLWRVERQPQYIVEQVLRYIPKEVLCNPSTKVADLSIGGGDYLKYILDMRIQAGVPREEAIKTLYGYESSKRYLDFARIKRDLQGANLAMLNLSEIENLNMVFDVVIGNPPYQETTKDGRKDQASNLWTKFWVKALELTADDGYVALITPTSWMSPSANLKGTFKLLGKNRLWDVFSYYTSHARIEGVKDYFKGVNSSFGIVSVSKAGRKGLTFLEGYRSDLGFLPKSGIENVLSKVGGASTLGDCYTVNQKCGSGWRVSTPLTRKVSPDSVEILKNEEVPTSGSKRVGLYLYAHVNSEEEATRVKEAILDGQDLLNTHCRWSGFMNIKIFKMINYVK
jgi:methylase of polypeptide subunit release factors